MFIHKTDNLGSVTFSSSIWIGSKMFIEKLFLVALCISLASSNFNMTHEILDRIFRYSNPEKLLNSQLNKFERRVQKVKRISAEDFEDSSQNLPEYDKIAQELRDRAMRQLGTQKHYPICHLERKIHKLNTNDYEYRPAYYEEIRCAKSLDVELDETNEICSSLGFACVQLNKTIHLTRRRYTSDCWEVRTLVILTGCECMWPVHKLGDNIRLHN